MYGDNIYIAPGIVSPNNARREYSDLLNGKSNRFLQIYLAVDLTISVAVVTSIKNGGHIAAAFEEMGINEGGTDVAAGDPLLFGFASEQSRPSAGTEVKLTSTAIASYSPRQLLRIYFEHPYSANPRETAFLEKAVNSKFRFFVKYSANVNTRLFVMGGATVVINAVTIDIDQYFDDGEAALPLFRPSWDTVVQPIAAAGAAIPIYLPLDVNTFLRGFTLMQTTGVNGLQTDVLTKLSFRGDRYNYIGPEQISASKLAQSMEFGQGGATYSADSSKMMHFDLQKYGRLSKIMTPVQDTNLRLVVTAAPSAAGAADSSIVVLRHLLLRDPYVGPDGRRVTAPEDVFRAALPAI